MKGGADDEITGGGYTATTPTDVANRPHIGLLFIEMERAGYLDFHPVMLTHLEAGHFTGPVQLQHGKISLGYGLPQQSGKAPDFTVVHKAHDTFLAATHDR